MPHSQYANTYSKQEGWFSPVPREIVLADNNDETNVPVYQGTNDDDSMGGTDDGLLRLTKWNCLNPECALCSL